nr:MAG TPA: hypothetical protein [Caudoviricetes sp.]
MASRYDFMIRPYVICIKNGARTIDDVRPQELRDGVIAAFAAEGLGPDAKPLPKENLEGIKNSNEEIAGTKEDETPDKTDEGSQKGETIENEAIAEDNHPEEQPKEDLNNKDFTKEIDKVDEEKETAPVDNNKEIE